MPGGKGVLVTDVIDDTPAAKVRHQGRTTSIVGVEGATIEDIGRSSRELRKHEGKTSITLMRRGAKRVVTPELEARQTTWYRR